MPPRKKELHMSKNINTNYGIQIAQIQIVTGRQNKYENGYYMAVFQRELAALVQDTDLKLNDYRILLLMMAYVDNNNCITISVKEITACLGCVKSTVYRTLQKLERMRIICLRSSTIDKDFRKYELSQRLINPRLAYYGNTQQLRKHNLPFILKADGVTPLLEQWSEPNPDF